jgi:hypothetical protein
VRACVLARARVLAVTEVVQVKSTIERP